VLYFTFLHASSWERCGSLESPWRFRSISFTR